MLSPAVFDPARAVCKSPFGAAAAGTAVTLALYPPRALGCTQITLILRYEQWENKVETHSVPWADLEGGADVYRTVLSVPADYQGLLWYSFTLDRGALHDPITSDEYQLTVYDGSDAVPDWFGQGMSYQIFPDRFCRLSVPEPVGPGDRLVHENWADHPAWQPEPGRGITNRDFFGGSLAGAESKLPYLASLGVETVYFNPIFEGVENHHYGTGDYEKIDPMIGDEASFVSFCKAAHQHGIRVILDGVFNHVGASSKYFNATGIYGDGGAARDHDSPYHDWFRWGNWPNEYDSWWGFKTLPAMNPYSQGYRHYLFGENGIVRRWLRLGADGWRLDVVDEVPDDFVYDLHAAVRAEKPDAVIIGEVWEDGSLKVAYDKRRKHILGRHCDGLMNYPLRTAILSYLWGGDARDFMTEMETIRDHYPPFAFYNAMNFLGTHDTPRILTLLGVGADHKGDWSREERAYYEMTPYELERGLRLLQMGLTLLFAFPGSPTVYYGDEAGVTGFEDPFNRKTYPWGHENEALRAFTGKLGQVRKTSPALRRGDISYLAAEGGLLAFARTLGKDWVVAAVNRDGLPAPLTLPGPAVDLLTGEIFPREAMLAQPRPYLFAPVSHRLL